MCICTYFEGSDEEQTDAGIEKSRFCSEAFKVLFFFALKMCFFAIAFSRAERHRHGVATVAL
jgi:hypothetical protein